MPFSSNWDWGSKPVMSISGTIMDKKRTLIGILVTALGGLVLASGCGSQNADTKLVTDDSGHFPHVVKNGAQIWADNCTRCHYARPSTQYSAQQWDIIITHMRVRADLNGAESRAVVKFMSGT